MKNKIFISAHLKDDKNQQGKFGLDVYKSLYDIEELEIIEIQNHKKNSWCRDYMPVKRADGKLVQFKYYPGYMRDIIKWEDSFPDAKAIEKELRDYGLEQEIIQSTIILDGGAIEVLDDQAILSDRVFRDNNAIDKYDLLKEIKDKLKLSRLIVIPQYPVNDFTGHVDGIVRFVNSQTVLINDESYLKKKEKYKSFYLGKLMEQWHYTFLMAFENAGLKVEKIPMTTFKALRNSKEKEFEGLHINFLKLDNLIVMPTFGKETDDVAASERLEELYNRKVIGIDATKLAPEGGLINCVTWSH